jgi:hypothetical protein
MIYLTLGDAVGDGAVLFRDIHDNKPPMLYYIAAIVGNVFWFRAMLAAWMVGTTILFWNLTKKLFPKEKNVQKVAVWVFAILSTIPLLEGQISNAELFMIGPTILGFTLLWDKEAKDKKIFLAGIVFSFSTLFKVPAAFDMLAIYFIWFAALSFKYKDVFKFLRRSVILAIGFVIPIAITFVWYYYQGAFSEYLIAAYLQNVGYLSSFRPEQVRDPFLVRNAPLLMRGGVVLVTMVILWLVRKKISREFIFVTAWLVFGLFAVTLSERPYPHYLIQTLPAISILVGMLVAKQTIEQSLAIIPLFLTMLVPVRYNFWYYPSLPYYANFIEFTTSNINREEYFDTFSDRVNENYTIASFIGNNTNPTDEVFVWGDSSAVYALSRRRPPIKYVADYHINDFSSKEEVLAKLNEQKPRYIVMLPNSEPFPGLVTFAESNYYFFDTIAGARIWRIMSMRYP